MGPGNSTPWLAALGSPLRVSFLLSLLLTTRTTRQTTSSCCCRQGIFYFKFGVELPDGSEEDPRVRANRDKDPGAVQVRNTSQVCGVLRYYPYTE
jgi:hypothetical protein